MNRRLELHEEFCGILGTRYAYFEPPENVKMKYPCIVYERAGFSKHNANDRKYVGTPRYSVTVIDTDPDSMIYEEILDTFSTCSYDRSFTSENLKHDVLTLYY